MVGIIIQARMGSTRMPGKTMSKIMDKPLLFYSVKRSSASKYVSKVIVATTTKELDNKIVDWCKSNSVLYYRGSEEDVLDRYYKAAVNFNLTKIIRVTSDNPFVDSQLIDLITLYSLNFDYDYVTLRYDTNTWPYGLDVEIIDFKALEKSWKESTETEDREHVTMYIKKNPSKFSILEVPYIEDLSDIRVTVDYIEDFQRANDLLYTLINKYGLYFNWYQVVEEIRKSPYLSKSDTSDCNLLR